MRPKLKKFGPRLTISVTPRDYGRLAHVAKENDASVSWVIRRAINEYLARTPEIEEPELPLINVPQ